MNQQKMLSHQECADSAKIPPPAAFGGGAEGGFAAVFAAAADGTQ